ncbi:single-stranded DNA-binding protein [Eggerthellaceae bacterium zg-893]|nr:single-stranded DNA-binding protein [Eggerthellaceae bacterium zg-893]
MSINSVTIKGNLTSDAKAMSTQSGIEVVEIGLAANNGKTNRQTGMWEDRPVFVDCTAFGDYVARKVPQLTKGTPVVVSGRLDMDQWTDRQTGQKRTKLKVVANDVEIVTKPPQQNGLQTYGAQHAPQQYAPQPAPAQQQYAAQQPAPQYAQQYAQPVPQQAQQPLPIAPGVPAHQQQARQAAPAPQPAAQAATVYDDDIPF